LEQSKDISLVDLLELGRTDIGRYGIIATTFSARHNYKIAKNLLKAFQKCELPHEGSPPRIHGARDDDWFIRKKIVLNV
jgi:ribosomal silencing factor RsfS